MGRACVREKSSPHFTLPFLPLSCYTLNTICMSDERPPVNPREWWDSLGRERQVSVAVFGVCGILALGLSVMHLRDQIRSPFLAPRSLLQQSDAILAKQISDDQAMEALKKKDTDHDGLSDYAELNIYHTSPYLADSDSDGIPDAVEIAQGTDPNCPEGKACGDIGSAVVEGSVTSSRAEFLNVTQVPKAPPEVLLGGASASSVAGVQEFVDSPPSPDSMTPDQIRAYLVSHNLAQASQVSALPDNLIIQIYAAAYQEAQRVQAASQSNVNSSSTMPSR